MTARGVTLVELMVSVAILGVVVLGGIRTFSGIHTGLQYSKARSLGTNLSQEKMQILKQQSYNKLMVSTSTAWRTDFTPSIEYDRAYYPPESILEGGIRFTRITQVQVAQEDSGNISTLPATTPDTGMKLITVTTIWSQGASSQKVQLRGIASNPNSVMSTVIMKGTVRNSVTSAVIPNALVNISENVGWRDTSNASGAYLINLSPGSYNSLATADGYFSSLAPVSIAPTTTLVKDWTLVPMATGTVKGAVWLNSHPVISQVVGSTENLNTGFIQEYVELFNPSTFTWTMASNATTPVIDLKYQIRGGAITTLNCMYNSLTIGPGKYYLFASTSPVYAGGVMRHADAVFLNSNAGYPNLIKINSDGGYDASSLGIAYTATGDWIDQIGWKTAGNDPPFYEGSPVDQFTGLQDQEQYTRRSSTSGVTSGIGRAYDTNNNNNDFIVTSPITHAPRSTADTEPVVSGTPAYGSFVTATDGLSSPATAYAAGNPPYAEFLLPRVATGTWTVLVTSGSRVLEISSVTLTANTTTWATNATTSPAWPAAGYSTVILSSATATGYVSGRVTNALGNVISPAISVAASGGGSVTAGTNGMYLLNLTPGIYTITANPNNTNEIYVSHNQTVTVLLGEVVNGVDFTLSQGGRISGFVTRDGTNALPGVGMVAINSSGVAMDQEVTGANGLYTLVNLATGTYTVQPVLDTGEASNPTSQTLTVTAGTTVSASTFTISGDMGYVTGTVTKSGSIIKTGVLVVVSTGTISAPPALSSTTLTGASYYSASSLEDGSYSVEVRGSSSTVYRVHAFYPTLSGQSVSISSSAVSSVSILAGQTTPNINFSW